MASIPLLRDPAAPPAEAGAAPSLDLRLRVLLQRRHLTQRLAEGADPSASPELALRARQLVARERRESLAILERVLREAAAPPRGLSARAPVQREAVLAARPFLLNLHEQLRAADDPQPAGIARTLILLSDGCGPIYAPSEQGNLASRVHGAAAAL
jgi:hypothetical protein